MAVHCKRRPLTARQKRRGLRTAQDGLVTNFRDWVRMDLEYIDNWSVFLDLYILIRTIPVVLAGSGAK